MKEKSKPKPKKKMLTNFDDEIYAKVKAAAALKGITKDQYLQEAAEEKLARESEAKNGST